MHKDINNYLESCWQKLLGVVQIQNTDNFFTVGGDRLLCNALIQCIKQKFEIELSINDIKKNSTLFRLANIIKYKLGQYQNKIVVKLQDGKQNLPLCIFVHPLGGTVFVYKNLITKLDLPNTMYAIQDRFIVGDFTHYESLVEQAKYYVELMSEYLQRKHPIILLGHSSGGTIAFEMAHHLLLKGFDVIHIVMFDSWIDVPFNIQIREVFRKIMCRQLEALKINVFFDEHMKLESWLEILWQRMDLVFEYKPKLIDKNATLFIPMEQVADYKLTTDVAKQWQPYLADIQEISVYGNHETMLYQKKDYILINELRKLILHLNKKISSLSYDCRS